MIDIKDFPEGTKLNILYTAPITEYYNEKLPPVYSSANSFKVYKDGIDTKLVLYDINIPFFLDKIDYSEVEVFNFDLQSSNYPAAPLGDVVIDMPKIKVADSGLLNFYYDNAGAKAKTITFNYGENVEIINGNLTFYTSNYTFILNSKSKKIKRLQNISMDGYRELYINCDCENLNTTPYMNLYSNNTSLTFHSGFPNCKNSSLNYYYEKLPNLTYESCISILNNLYDFVGNGVTPNSSQGKLKVHANFLTLVGDELSIGTSRGWIITA